MGPSFRWPCAGQEGIWRNPPKHLQAKCRSMPRHACRGAALQRMKTVLLEKRGGAGESMRGCRCRPWPSPRHPQRGLDFPGTAIKYTRHLPACPPPVKLPFAQLYHQLHDIRLAKTVPRRGCDNTRRHGERNRSEIFPFFVSVWENTQCPGTSVQGLEKLA